VARAGQKLFVFMLSHFFSSFFDDAAQPITSLHQFNFSISHKFNKISTLLSKRCYHTIFTEETGIPIISSIYHPVSFPL
jgi:hypothetical protein